MKNILCLTFYFAPDPCPGSFRNTPLIKELGQQAKGCTLFDVVTTLPNRYSSFDVSASEYNQGDNYIVYRIAIAKRQSGMNDQIISFKEYYQKILNYVSSKDYDFVSYLEFVSLEKVYNVLEQNDFLLLPTLYEGEGFPGAIIDTYIGEISVLVSERKQIPEFVKRVQTGFLFDLEKQEDFNEYILYLFENRDKLDVIKNLAKAYSEEYSSLKTWNIIKAYH